MFTLAKQAKYWWPIEFSIPSTQTPGAFETAGFEVEFRYLSVAEAAEITEKARAEDQADRDVLPKLINDFRGVKDEAGRDVPFSADTLVALTLVPNVATAIVAAFWASRAGAPAKNSPTLPASGPVAA